MVHITSIIIYLINKFPPFRFLVFTDDGAAVYVGLPLLHVVCRPCTFEMLLLIKMLIWMLEMLYTKWKKKTFIDPTKEKLLP